MIKRISISLAVFFVIFFLVPDAVVYTYSLPDPTQHLVRVCIQRNAPELSLTVKGAYKVLALHTNQVLAEGPLLKGVTVFGTMSGIRLGAEEFKIYGIKIVPKRDSTVYLNRRRFRGSIDIIRTEDLKLMVVNHIDVEDYLRGVLYHEVSHWWPMEVLKAQAITARTYALYQKSVSKSRDYDLTSDIYSQVYGGKFSEKWRTDRAVKASRGKVLTFNGKIFPTYYHATCGGHTEDASRLWNIDLDCLKGTKCNFCKKSPHYHWKKEVSLSDVESRLKKSGFKIGAISAIRTVGRNAAGRVENVEIKSSTATLTISAKDFRNSVGNNFLRSINFESNIKRNKVSFEGYGWGHGVGMCQWGAYFMSKRHFKTIEILNFYYPGTKIARYKSETH